MPVKATSVSMTRLEPRIDKEGPTVDPALGACWLWRGKRHKSGYGLASNLGREVRVHRAVYELCVGPIPAGLQLDHLCRVRLCCNPAHLEPVTNAENQRRGIRANLTHCPYGHPYDDANTWRNSRGHKACRTCHRYRERARQRALRGPAHIDVFMPTIADCYRITGYHAVRVLVTNTQEEVS